MAFWITHLAVADALLKKFPSLNRHAFCIGNIAPDCNIENEDWSSFTPPREMTQFMSGKDKAFSDCERFYRAYISGKTFVSQAQRAFLFGYYAHLVTDVMHQDFMRDEARVCKVWERIEEDESLSEMAKGLRHTWANAKKLFPKEKRFLEQSVLEAEYLSEHPDSGYFTEILPLKECETYIDFLPGSYIVRKIAVMANVPERGSIEKFYTITREEYKEFLSNAIMALKKAFLEKGLP